MCATPRAIWPGRMRERACRFVIAVRDDTGGFVLPFVALLLAVFIGFSALTFDVGRQMSLQTQMQEIADALAIAGARELNQQPGAQARATNAMNALVSNGLTGMGFSGSITHSVAWYSALPAAAAGFTGTVATSDVTTKFVAVTVTPVAITKFFPITVGSTMSAGAQAIAGFTAQAFCDIPPVFICNPYETSGMSDSEATAALRTAIEDPATKQKMLRMDQSNTSPGHFGYLVPPDGCNGASCLKAWIAKTHPNTCYQTSSVDLNTGAMASVADGFNVRFDIYAGSLSYSADYAPSVNVRKGYNTTTGNWCSANPSNPYYTTLPLRPADRSLGRFKVGRCVRRLDVRSAAGALWPGLDGRRRRENPGGRISLDRVGRRTTIRDIARAVLQRSRRRRKI